MEPLVYAMPKYDQTIKPSELVIRFDDHASPKLIKYGFNNIGNQLDMVMLTSNPSYKVGLEFDFEQTDKYSIVDQAQQNFGIKNFDQTFGELWEIFTLFGLLDSDQTIFSPQNGSTIANIVNSYQKITNDKYKIRVVDNNDKMTNITTIVYKYSDIDIDENAAVQFIINKLPELLAIQSEGSNMILQLFNMQTQITSEIIYLLNNLYTGAYLIKPSIVSDLFDTKYIVLMGLKSKFTLVVPEHSNDVYLSSLGFDNLPVNFDTTIKCMNSDIIPKKFKHYNIIKSYLDTKVYEGATYQKMIELQKMNTKKWLETFSNIKNLKNILDNSLNKTNTKCSTYTQLINIFN